VSTSTTQDRLQQAKDALLHALRAAEKELKPADVKKVERLVGQTEALQGTIKHKYKD
jgi:hypothetical protein